MYLFCGTGGEFEIVDLKSTTGVVVRVIRTSIVEAIILGAVVGFMLATTFGLLSVAGCYYIGISRLIVPLALAGV